jgi:class 3 adenylate cyclase
MGSGRGGDAVRTRQGGDRRARMADPRRHPDRLGGARHRGADQIRFDLWGDTVNVAARLSGLGDAWTLHLTREAFACLSDLRSVTPIGRVMLEGNGEVEVCCRALGSAFISMIGPGSARSGRKQ